MKKEPKQSQIILYKTTDGKAQVDVQFLDETAWLAQKNLAQLFGVDVRTVNEHLKNIFKTGENILLYAGKVNYNKAIAKATAEYKSIKLKN